MILHSADPTLEPDVSRWKQPVMTGSFTIEGVTYPTFAYPMEGAPRTWPTMGGIYAVSGTYDGNAGRNLVGKTDMERGFSARWKGHRDDLRRGVHDNSYLQASYARHPNEFVFWVLETGIPTAQLGGREAFWYRHLQSDHALCGWNIQVPLDDGTCQLAEETRAKLRAHNLGRHHTPETRAKMSATRLREGTWNKGLRGEQSHLHGRPPCALAVQRNRERCGPKHYAYGKKATAEQRQVLSDASKRRIPVTFRSPDGETVTFGAMRRFAAHLGCPSTTVRAFLRRASVGDAFRGWCLLAPYRPR